MRHTIAILSHANDCSFVVFSDIHFLLFLSSPISSVSKGTVQEISNLCIITLFGFTLIFVRKYLFIVLEKYQHYFRNLILLFVQNRIICWIIFYIYNTENPFDPILKINPSNTVERMMTRL